MNDSSRYAGEKRIQTSEESLHWISFNLKKLVEQVKDTNSLLASLRNELLTSKPDQKDPPF